MAADVAVRAGKTEDRGIIGFTGTGGIDDLLRLHVEQGCDGGRQRVHARSGGAAGRMGGIGVAGKGKLRLAEALQDGGICRGVGGIVEIDRPR